MRTCLHRLVFWILLGFAWTAHADSVVLIRVNGVISPATSGYISRAIDQASSEGAQCLIIQLDTPGGLLDSTKSIVQSFYESDVPIVVYVAPSGANATSAGCFITMAADIAAMAPNTSIGAAHPVAIGASGGAEQQDDVMKQKLENFTVSYMETIAQKRGRNAEWAKSAVLESANITAETALATNVIDIVAEDMPDLLAQLNGRTVNEDSLNTVNAEIAEIPMNTREKVFQMMWRPEVLMILMLIAMYGIIGEVSNPGGIIPGVVGVVALIIVLYMSAVLPTNIAGFALIVLAVLLFVAEAFTPTTGVLAGGGSISLFFGLFFLFDRTDPVFRLSLSFIIPATIITTLFFLFIVIAGLRAQSIRIKVGRETMIGKHAPVISEIDSQSGKVFVEGEYWNAVSNTPIEEGQDVEIVGMDGLTLKVKQKSM